MGKILYNAICQSVGEIALFLVIVPVAVVAVGYLIGIAIMSFKELRKK